MIPSELLRFAVVHLLGRIHFQSNPVCSKFVLLSISDLPQIIITHSLDVQQHCLCALCNFAGVKDCAASMVSQGAVAAIMKLCDAMKNEELNRRCAESLSNLAGVNATHEFIVGDGGVSALVDLALSWAHRG